MLSGSGGVRTHRVALGSHPEGRFGVGPLGSPVRWQGDFFLAAGESPKFAVLDAWIRLRRWKAGAAYATAGPKVRPKVGRSRDWLGWTP